MAAAVLDFTLDGIPFLYNGQEVADPSATYWRKPCAHSLAGDSGSPRGRKDDGGNARTQYKTLASQGARSEPALTSGSVIWINNTEPKSVLSFMRKRGDAEMLVILNLSNREVHVTIDLPVMDYYKVQNLILTWRNMVSTIFRTHIRQTGSFRLRCRQKNSAGAIER